MTFSENQVSICNVKSSSEILTFGRNKSKIWSLKEIIVDNNWKTLVYLKILSKESKISLITLQQQRDIRANALLKPFELFLLDSFQVVLRILFLA